MLEGQGSIALEKAANEVRFWLGENGKDMEEDEIIKVAEKALDWFVNHDYSSLGAAVEDILTDRFSKKGGKK